jgi:hypothetical protein
MPKTETIVEVFLPLAGYFPSAFHKTFSTLRIDKHLQNFNNKKRKTNSD